VDYKDLDYLLWDPLRHWSTWPWGFNFVDYAHFAKYWLQPVDYKWRDFRPDLNGDWVVDFKDFAMFAAQWQPGPMSGELSFDGEPNNLSGYVTMSIAEPEPNTYRVFTLIDGTLHREFFIETESPFVKIHTERFANGPHSIKIVSMDIYGNVICSQTNEVIFNNELSSVAMSECYELDKPYCLCAFGSPEANYTVDVNDSFDGNTVYSGNFTGSIQAVVPAEAFAADHIIYDLMVVNSSSPEGPRICAMLGKNYDKDGYNPNAKMVVSVGSEIASTHCKDVIDAALTAGMAKIATKGKYDEVIYLGHGKSTWDRVKYCLQLPYVKIWVHFSHGTPDHIWFTGENIEKDEKVYAFKDWGPHSLEELGFKENPKLNFVYFHTCEGAATDDFAEALGILPVEGVGDKAFIGWTIGVFTKQGASIYFQSFNPYTEYLWYALGSGNTLRDAKASAWNAIKGGEQIYNLSPYLKDYGVVEEAGTIKPGDQFIIFNYPNSVLPH
jgi:hypothetical protein